MSVSRLSRPDAVPRLVPLRSGTGAALITATVLASATTAVDANVIKVAVPDVVYTDPQAAAVGETEGRFSVTVPMADVAKAATYAHDYASSGGFLTERPWKPRRRPLKSRTGKPIRCW